MDIDLLSKMVKELILDNDRVVLPGLGYFAAEIVPSTFSDRGYTINPPYRKLYFRQDSGRDGLLARLYAESNGTGTDVAEHIIEDFVRDMRKVLDKEKVMIFPGLGRLRATRENNYFFVPDEDMDIFPEGAGLEPVSLKTHSVKSPAAEIEKTSFPGLPVDVLPAESNVNAASSVASDNDVEPIEVDGVSGVPAGEAHQEFAGHSGMQSLESSQSFEPSQSMEPSQSFESSQSMEEPSQLMESSHSMEPSQEPMPSVPPVSSTMSSMSPVTPVPSVEPQTMLSDDSSGSPVETPDPEPCDDALQQAVENVSNAQSVEDDAEVPPAVVAAGTGSKESGAGQEESSPGHEETASSPEETSPEPSAGLDLAVPGAETQEQSVQESSAGGRIVPRWLKVLIVIFVTLVAVAVLALAAFLLLADLCPDFINSILYSPEELEILNY